jgi:hypothetical protein
VFWLFGTCTGTFPLFIKKMYRTQRVSDYHKQQQPEC